MKVKPDISKFNLLAIPIIAIGSVTYSQDILALTVFLFMDPDYFIIPKDEIGRAVNEMLFYVVPF